MQTQKKLAFCITCMNRLSHIQKTLVDNMENNFLPNTVNKKDIERKYMNTNNGILQYINLSNLKMKDKIALLSIISEKLLLKDSFSENIGLLNGKTGIAIFFFHYAKFIKNRDYNDFACELVGEIYKEINTCLTCDFSDGLCGIGWGMLYLMEQNFIEGDPDEVLEEIDHYLVQNCLDMLKKSKILYDINSRGFVNYIINRNLINNILNQFENSTESMHLFQELKEIVESKMQATDGFEDTYTFLKKELLFFDNKRYDISWDLLYNVNILNGLSLLLSENHYL